MADHGLQHGQRPIDNCRAADRRGAHAYLEVIAYLKGVADAVATMSTEQGPMSPPKDPCPDIDRSSLLGVVVDFGRNVATAFIAPPIVLPGFDDA